MIEGDIRNVRQLKSGWQADMVLGVSGSQPRMVTVQVVCKSPEVEKLADQLRDAIRTEAIEVLTESVSDGRFRKAIGR